MIEEDPGCALYVLNEVVDLSQSQPLKQALKNNKDNDKNGAYIISGNVIYFLSKEANQSILEKIGNGDWVEDIKTNQGIKAIDLKGGDVVRKDLTLEEIKAIKLNCQRQNLTTQLQDHLVSIKEALANNKLARIQDLETNIELCKTFNQEQEINEMKQKIANINSVRSLYIVVPNQSTLGDESCYAKEVRIEAEQIANQDIISENRTDEIVTVSTNYNAPNKQDLPSQEEGTTYAKINLRGDDPQMQTIELQFKDRYAITTANKNTFEFQYNSSEKGLQAEINELTKIVQEIATISTIITKNYKTYDAFFKQESEEIQALRNIMRKCSKTSGKLINRCNYSIMLQKPSLRALFAKQSSNIHVSAKILGNVLT